jgi:hypothetical protein
MSFSKVALGFFRLFLLIKPFGHLEYFIYKTSESVAVPGLMLSLGMENIHAIRKPSNSPNLGWYSLLHHGCSTVLIEQYAFLFLSWPLDKLGWSAWPESFSFFYSLVSRITSSVRAYLLAMVNIASDVLGFFMASLRIRDGSLSPILKNMIIDLSSTSRKIFLLL